MKRGNILGVESWEGESGEWIDLLFRLPRPPGRTENLPKTRAGVDSISGGRPVSSLRGEPREGPADSITGLFPDQVLQILQAAAGVEGFGVDPKCQVAIPAGEYGGKINVVNPVAFVQFVPMQEFEGAIQALQERLPFPAPAQRRVCEGAEVALVGLGGKDLVGEVAEGVEHAAVRVVDENESGFHFAGPAKNPRRSLTPG